jgi:acyl carrier protein
MSVLIFTMLSKKIINSAEITIDDNEKFDDYGLDSLDRMNLLLEMEERTGCDFGAT